MENGSGNVLTRHIAGYKVLNICLAEHAATRSHGINLRGTERKSVEFVIACVEQNCHLVNKCPRSACTISVHAQIGCTTAVKKHHFCIFAANVNHCFGFGMGTAHIISRSHHFLYKGNVATLRDSHAHTTRYADAEKRIARHAPQIAAKVRNTVFDTSLMAHIISVNRFAIRVKSHNLGGCGTNINTYLI